MWLVKDLIVILKGRFCCFAKEPVEDVTVWSESIEKLLESPGKKLHFDLCYVEGFFLANLRATFNKKNNKIKKTEVIC